LAKKRKKNKFELKAIYIPIFLIVIISILMLSSSVMVTNNIIKEMSKEEIQAINIRVENLGEEIVVITEATNDLIELKKESREYLEELFRTNNLNLKESEINEELKIREILYYNAKNKLSVNTLDSIKINLEKLKSLETENQNNFMEKYEEEIFKDYIIQEFFNKELILKIPTEEVIELNHILICYEGTIDCTQNRTKDLANTLAQEIYDTKVKNVDYSKFIEVAKEHSDGESRTQGGYIGYARRGDLIEEFERVAFSLEIGEISLPIETIYGYHIIRVNKKEIVPNSIIATSILEEIQMAILNEIN